MPMQTPAWLHVITKAREQRTCVRQPYRMAEFYVHGHPDDPRIVAQAELSAKVYAEAARLTGPTWEAVQIP